MTVFNVLIEDRDNLLFDVVTYKDQDKAWEHIVSDIKANYDIDIENLDEENADIEVTPGVSVYLMQKDVYYEVKETPVR